MPTVYTTCIRCFIRCALLCCLATTSSR